MRIIRLVFCAFLVAAIAAPVRGATLDTIHVGDPKSESGANLYYAEELGLFTKAGLKIESQPVLNGPAAATAVASGSVDVAMAVVTSLAVAHGKGIPLVAVAAGSLWDSRAPYAGIVVANSSPIHTAKDLNGKTIAVPGLSTIMEYGVRSWMEQNGGDPSSVKIIEAPLATMTAALASGRVDAVAITEPFFAIAKRNGRVIGYHYDAVGDKFLTTAWLSTPQWASTHTDILARFVSVMREAARWGNNPANHAQREAILDKYLKLDPDLMKGVVSTPYGEELTPALLQPQVDLAAKYGKFPPFPAREIIFSP